jgi:uncharacterized repeat protein (TIGR01451 family)
MQRMLQVVLALVLMAPMAAWTQQKSAIALRSVAEVEVAEKNEKGETVVKLVDVAKATTVPGNTVVFTTHYINTGKQSATSVVITNPIDENMIYLASSAEGSNTRIEFSTDGGKNYNAPEKLMVNNSQGMVRQARAEDYNGIRWTLTKPLSAGGTGSVSFKAKIK